MTKQHIDLNETWAEGKLQVVPGESIFFRGTVMGVNLHEDGKIDLTFNARSGGVYEYDEGKLDGFATPGTQGLIIKHVEMALIDAGYSIAPEAASPDYEADGQ